MTRHRNSTPRDTFLADQRAAAVADTGRIVREAAHNAGRHLDDLQVDDAQDLAHDPLTQRAVGMFLVMHRLGRIDTCRHINDETTPAPRWWTSALPNKVWCGRGGCTVLAVNFALQTQGLLPAACAVCSAPESKPRLDVALDDVRLVLHTCLPCFRRLTPGNLQEGAS